MRYNADIFDLIKSLTKAEKRYFKIYAAQHTKKENNNYILLFDAIDRQDEYNEEKLRYKFRKYTFSKNIAKTKYLLYELIVKMLRQLHNGKSIESKISGLIESASYLYKKSLYDQAYASLQKAKKLATFFENYEYLLQILGQEGKFIGKLQKNSLSLNKLGLIDAFRKVKSCIELELEYKLLLQEVQWLVSLKFQDDKKGDLIKIEKRVDIDLIKNGEELAKTFLSKVYLWEVKVLHAFVIHDIEKTFYCLDQWHQLWSENEEKCDVYKEDYTRFCTTYMKCCTDIKQKGRHYDELLLSLQGFGIPDIKSSDNNFLLASSHDFIFNLTSGNLEICNIQIFTIKELLEEHAAKLDQLSQVNLYYHISVFYFLKGDFSETLNWIDKIYAEDVKNSFQNIQNYIRLLSLMAKYGESEFEALEYDILKTYRFLNKGKSIRPIERIILTSVKQLLNIKHPREEMVVFADLYFALHDYYQKDVSPVGKLTAGDAIYKWIRNKLPNGDTSLLN